MTSFLSHVHADLRRARLTKRGATHRAEDVPRGTHKAYPRMRSIPLPEPQALSITLQEALVNRRSGFSDNAEAPLLLSDLGTLLGLALRKHPEGSRRHYPSGGGLYPVETYLISAAIESQTPAAYHYNPTKHTLERLWDLPDNFNMKDVAKHPPSLQLSTLIVFTGVWQRSSAKYGDLAYLHAILEAGHMSENMLLVGSALDVSMRPYAGFNDALIAQLLDLDEEEEQSLHTITVCKGAKLAIPEASDTLEN